MKTSAKFASLLLLLNIVFSVKLAAQVSGEVGYSLLYTDNPFRTSSGQEEFVNFVQPSLTFKPFQSEFYLGYSFGYSRFKNLSDRSYYYNSGELNYAFRLGVDSTEDENIFMGASYMKASNNSGGGLYSYDSYSVFANGKYFLSDNMLFSAGYGLSGKSYPSLYDLSYTVNSGFARLSLFLETKTSLFLEMQLGNKAYSVTDQTLITIDRNGPMMGGKRVIQKTDYVTTNITQLRIMPKISQSVFEGVGMNIHYMWRRNLDRNSAISLSEFIYSDDEDLWDDPYSFESNEFGSEWTIKLPWSSSIKLSAEQSYRNYSENLAQTGTVSKRKDTRTEFWFALNKEFTDVPLISNIEAGIEFMRVMNRSNESALTYNNNIAMFHIGLSF
ncbi:MAG: hypothetical protein HF312_11005 [Ignavibacteria bacterium]|jgi:hypothetical protein|nr:hypothetical protein [Ignavibacteria bacterium]